MDSLTGPTTATIKRLFAVSGNRCAFPKCVSTLIDGKKVVGKICHIKAQNEGGPRFDPNQTPEERHGYDNLILMCGRHHDVIDDDEEAYTVEYLHRLKAKHEQSAGRLSEDEAEHGAKLFFLNQSISSINQSGGVIAHTINIHNFPPSQQPEVNQPPTGFIAVIAKEGNARFRAADEPIGYFWNTLPFAQSPDYEIFLAKGPAIWLRLIPQDAVSHEWSNDELMNCGRRQGTFLLPLSWGNMQYLRAEDGMGAFATADPMNLSLATDSIAFAFNTGELWSIDTSVLGMAAVKRHLYFLDIARTLIPMLREYGQFLCSLGIQPPFKWIAGLEGIKGWRLQVPPPPHHISTSAGDTCFKDVVEASGTYDPAQPPAISLLPFFARLFQRCGKTIPPHIEALIRANGSF
ncbi:MAG: hypothetical protein ACLPXT_15990 [Terracidiphilus sp.]